MIIALALKFTRIPDCPADLEVEDTEIIGAYENGTKAGTAIERSKIETCRLDGTNVERWGDEYPDVRFEIMPMGVK